MLDHYVISTNLHLFQAYHISRSNPDRKSIFHIEKSVSCLFTEELLGKKLYFNRNDSYIKAILGSIFVKRRATKGRRIFFGNQAHSIVSILLSKFIFEEIFVLDDGLQYYNLGVEKKNSLWKIKNILIRDTLNQAISNTSTQIVSTRNYLSFHGITPQPKLISVLSGIIQDPPCNSIGLVPFSAFFNSTRHREISEKYFKKEDRFIFLSYTDSKNPLPTPMHDPAPSNTTLIPHPKFRKTKYQCPFEFAWPENLASVTKKTSLYYALEFTASNDHKIQ